MDGECRWSIEEMFKCCLLLSARDYSLCVVLEFSHFLAYHGKPVVFFAPIGFVIVLCILER